MRGVLLVAFIATLPFWVHAAAHVLGVEIRLLGPGGVLSTQGLTKVSVTDGEFDWREREYLAANPDVADAIKRGTLASGLEHYTKFGKAEGRPLGLSEPQSRSGHSDPKEKAQASKAADPVPAQGGYAQEGMEPKSGASAIGAAASASIESPPTRTTNTAEAPGAKGQAPSVVQQGEALARIAEIAQIQAADRARLNSDPSSGALPPGTVVTLPQPWPAPSHTPENASPRPPAPLPASKPPSSPAERASGVVIRQIRFGLHANVVRLVLDASNQTAFHASIRADGKALIVEVPQAVWRAERQGQAPKNSVLSSYTVESGATTNRLVVASRDVIQLKMAKLFPPNETAGYRIVIDVEQGSGRALVR